MRVDGSRFPGRLLSLSLVALVGVIALGSSPLAAEQTTNSIAQALLNEQIRSQTLQQLIRAGSDSLPHVRGLLDHPSPQIRVAGLTVLARIGDRQSYALFRKCFVDPDDSVRAAAAKTAGQLRLREAVPALAAALPDFEPRVRVEAMVALSLLDDQAALPTARALIASQETKDGDLQVALLSVGQLRDTSSVDALLAISQDPSRTPKAKGAALVALGQIAGPRALDAITASVRNPSPVVRFHAAAALGVLGGEAAQERLRILILDQGEELYVRIRALWALQSTGGHRSSEILLSVAREHDDLIALHAVRALRHSASTRTRAVAYSLSVRAQDEYIRKSAAAIAAGGLEDGVR